MTYSADYLAWLKSLDSRFNVTAGHIWEAAQAELLARLAEPEPVAWLASAKDGDDDCLYWDGEDAQIDGYAFVEPLYRHPPRPVRLGDDEISDFAREMVKGGKSVNWLARAIESAILEKNQ